MLILKKLRKDRDMTQSELANILGVSPSTIGMYEQGRREPDSKTLLNMAKFFNVSTDYLLGNDGDEEENEDSPAYIKRIPVLGCVVAGVPIEAIEDVIGWEEIDTRQHGFRSGVFFGLVVTGRSMEPTMYEGDIVIVRQQPRVENGEIAIVSVNGTDATVKQVKFTSKGLTLIGHNPSVYPPTFYTPQEVEEMPIQIVGKVVQLRRGF